MAPSAAGRHESSGCGGHGSRLGRSGARYRTRRPLKSTRGLAKVVAKEGAAHGVRANVVAMFLATFPSNALTGQSIVVSHGWSMH